VVIEAWLEELAKSGTIPPKAVAHWRAPRGMDNVPHPKHNEDITFHAFYERGLGHPANPFLLRSLEEWGLELQHLNPNGVLHIAGFVMLCEAFLGIDPHVNLFREIFGGRTIIVKRDPAAMPADMISAPVGNFGLQQKPGKSASYLPYTPVDSHRGWHEEWFYIRNPAKREEAFPTFTGKCPEKKES